MSQLVIWMVFAVAFLIALIRGPGWAFALVYLPALLMLNQLPSINLAHAPVQAEYAPIYGIFLALPFRNNGLRLKWSSLDTIVLLLWISATITALSTENIEAGFNNFRNQFMEWIGPYFLARLVFRDIEIRKITLTVLIGLVGLITVLGIIEFRFSPYFYLHLLQNIGMGNRIQAMAYYRYGFNRVAGTVEHPIYFGNMFLVILGMLAVLARTTGKPLKNAWVVLALLAAFACIGMSISFTPYLGLIAGTGAFFALMLAPFSRRLIVPMTLMIIVIVFAWTYTVAHTPLGEKDDSNLGGSYYTRKVIVQESWKRAEKAGLFGWGRFINEDDHEETFGLASVDNSYMLFAMQRGWVYVTLWISIGVFFSIRVSGAFKRATHSSQIFPLAVMTATVLGLMASMLTVWAGALYVVVWAIMLGLSNTLIDLIMNPEMIQAQAAPGGFPTVMSGSLAPTVPSAVRQPAMRLA